MPVNAVPQKIYVYRLNDQLVQINGLQDAETLVYYSVATVTATLVDQFGNDVPNFVDIPMTYVAGTQGNYVGLVDSDFNPPLGQGYTLQITALVPGGADPSGNTTGYWEIPVVVVPRTQ